MLSADTIAENAWRVRIPLDGHSIGSVNCFVFASPEGLMLVDPGWGTDDIQEALAATLAVLPVDVPKVVLVVASHVHADHAGGLGFWSRRGAKVAMNGKEAEQLPRRYLGNEFRSATAQWSVQAGLPVALAASAQRQVDGWQERVEVAPIIITIEDNDEIFFGSFSFLAVETPGHTAGHICLLERTNGLLLSGDTLFATISYGPTFRPIAFENPLGAYRASLERLSKLDNSVVRVHPGHLSPFDGLAARTSEVLHHHSRRQEHVFDALLRTPLTAYGVARAIPRTREWDELRAMQQLSAVGDVLAHLVNLRVAGSISCTQRVSGEQLWTVRS